MHHGTPLHLLREVITNMQTSETEEDYEYNQEFIDALFGFITSTLSSQSGGLMLIQAGIVEVFIQGLKVTKLVSYKNVIKLVNGLDNIVYSFTNAFNVFATANGVDILIGKIANEISECNLVIQEKSIEDSISQDRLGLLRALLKLILHLMQSSGTNEQMRHIVDTSLPKALDSIFKSSESYGANVFGIGILILLYSIMIWKRSQLWRHLSIMKRLPCQHYKKLDYPKYF